MVVKQEFKPEEVELLRKLDKGRYDIRLFARDILGIDTNPAQDRWFELIKVAEDGYSWETLYSIHVAANQVGKTLGMAIIILAGSDMPGSVKERHGTTGRVCRTMPEDRSCLPQSCRSQPTE